MPKKKKRRKPRKSAKTKIEELQKIIDTTTSDTKRYKASRDIKGVQISELQKRINKGTHYTPPTKPKTKRKGKLGTLQPMHDAGGESGE